jgi:type VI secretion system secreted protein VgrG
MADDLVVGLEAPLQKLTVMSLRGFEGISKLFRFDLELLAELRTKVEFDQIIGSKVTAWVILPDKKTKRYFNGIVSSLAQTGRDSTFNHFHMEVVPQLWLSTLKTDCRIFQHEAVPDILKKVLTGIDVKFELQGTFEKRDYCVQYRETDFAFASRLMEEEGIYYFFKHTDKGHQMIVANSPQSHPDDPVQKAVAFDDSEGGTREDMRVYRWEKTQNLRSGKVTLWDHCFQLPHKHLEAERPTQEVVAVGKVTHKLALAANKPLEQYDYPGAYAQRVDDHDAGGGEKGGDLAKIFQDNKRTVAIRMEQEAVRSITIRGNSNCRYLCAGFKLTLERHFDADGTYILTTVEHFVQGPDPRTGGGGFRYQNSFTCIPIALPFRPPLETPEPVIPGPQTAVVVGPPGEKIFCDKYARIKVQFHWDRKGKNDADSSCWLRVSQNWGGGNWGGMFIPHVGQEVIVDFEEGDPDRPVVTGRVYNAQCMPPLKLPDGKTQSIIRDHGGNQIKIEGDKGKEQIHMFSPHSNTHFTLGAARNPPLGISAITDGFFSGSFGQSWDVIIGANETTSVDGHSTKTVDGYAETYVHGHYVQYVAGTVSNRTLGSSTTFIGGAENTITVGIKNEVLIALNNRYVKGGLIEINNAHELYKAPRLMSKADIRLEKCIEEMKKEDQLKEVINAVYDQKVATMNAKIDTLNQKMSTLNAKITTLKYEVTSMKAEGDNIVLDGKSQVELMSALVKLKGTTDIDSKLKVG